MTRNDFTDKVTDILYIAGRPLDIMAIIIQYAIALVEWTIAHLKGYRVTITDTGDAVEMNISFEANIFYAIIHRMELAIFGLYDFITVYIEFRLRYGFKWTLLDIVNVLPREHRVLATIAMVIDTITYKVTGA